MGKCDLPIYGMISNPVPFLRSSTPGGEGETEVNPVILLEDQQDAFLKHSANLPVSTVLWLSDGSLYCSNI